MKITGITIPETRRNKFIPFRFTHKSLHNSKWYHKIHGSVTFIGNPNSNIYTFVFHSRSFSWFSCKRSILNWWRQNDRAYSDSHLYTHAQARMQTSPLNKTRWDRAEIILLMLFWCDVSSHRIPNIPYNTNQICRTIRFFFVVVRMHERVYTHTQTFVYPLHTRMPATKWNYIWISKDFLRGRLFTFS